MLKAKVFPLNLPVQPNKRGHDFTWKSENMASTMLSKSLCKESRHLLDYLLCGEELGPSQGQL